MCSTISITALNTEKPWVPSNANSPSGRTTSPPCCPQHSLLPRLRDVDPKREGEIYEWKIQHHSRWSVNSILFQTGNYRTILVQHQWKHQWKKHQKFGRFSPTFTLLKSLHSSFQFKRSKRFAEKKSTSCTGIIMEFFGKALNMTIDLYCLIPPNGSHFMTL